MISATSATGIVYCPDYLSHELESGHPESPRRLRAIIDELEITGTLGMLRPVAGMSDSETLLHAAAIHSDAHLQSLGSCPKIATAALKAAGGVLAAARDVAQGHLTNAFCAVRPPGHHAHNNGAHHDGYCQGEGFCFLNNVAIAARFLQKQCGFGRILILDWDYHHGNGTQWAFYDDPSVFVFSTHSARAYPGTGSFDCRGQGPGEGYTLNIPLPPGAGDTEILTAWSRELIPAMKRVNFSPDFVLISAGFDGRVGDPLGDFTITDRGFSRLTDIAVKIASQHCRGRLVSVLEGGYNPSGLAKAVVAHIRGLLGGSRHREQ